MSRKILESKVSMQTKIVCRNFLNETTVRDGKQVLHKGFIKCPKNKCQHFKITGIL
jgi:hypothetical protein